MVVEDGQDNRPVPLTGWIQNTDFGMVKVQMPQSMDMGDFKAAHFTLFKSPGGALLSGTRSRWFVALPPAVVAHATQHGFVAGHRPQLRRLLNPGRQIIVVQLDVPAWMGLVLRFQLGQQRIGHGPADTGIAADLSA